jgi:hypothetical protein
MKKGGRSILMLSVVWFGMSACAAQTQYSNFTPQQLSDEQLIGEIESAAAGLGATINSNAYLMAVRPEPAYVLTSSTTAFSGTLNARYNAYSMPVGYGTQTRGSINGSVSGQSNTQYQYTDVNAAARLGNSIAMAISQARERKYRQRAEEVWQEYQSRVASRRYQAEARIATFFSANPNLLQKRMLVAAVAPWAAAEGGSPEETLERTKNMISTMNRGPGLSGTWYGMFSQKSVTETGETIAFSQFVRLDLTEKGGRITGDGLIGSGEVLSLTGELAGSRLSAAVANTTSAINVQLTGIVAPTQITGEFEGGGAGQHISGSVTLLR